MNCTSPRALDQDLHRHAGARLGYDAVPGGRMTEVVEQHGGLIMVADPSTH